MASHGHRSVPHTADLRIEAWGRTREECLAEAARGMIDSFADIAGVRPRREAEVDLAAGSDEDLLVALLDEVIYRMDADDEVPVAVTVRPAASGRVNVALGLTGLDAVEITGAAPKAVSLHEIRCSASAAGEWSASVTVDV